MGSQAEWKHQPFSAIGWQWLDKTYTEIDQFNGGSHKQIVIRETEQIKILSNDSLTATYSVAIQLHMKSFGWFERFLCVCDRDRE